MGPRLGMSYAEAEAGAEAGADTDEDAGALSSRLLEYGCNPRDMAP
jgi:hypothetical protein